MEEHNNNSSLLRGKCLFVITGASRGIGREIAVQFSKNASTTKKATSHFLLIARTESDLRSTEEEIRKNAPPGSTNCQILVCDISKISGGEGNALGNFEEKLTSAAAKNVGGEIFDCAFLIHNAGSVGDVSLPVAQVENAQVIREHLEINVVSFILLNNAFLRIIGTETAKRRVVVNITSLLAIKSMPSYGIYPVGKAAREAFLRSLSVENPDIRILNYSPGPVKTAMTDYVSGAMWDDVGRQWWKEALEKGNILVPEQTVFKLMRLLDENKFENAAHIDYYDVP